MSHYIALLEPTRAEMVSQGPTAAEAAVIDAHLAYLTGEHARGSLLFAGRHLDGPQSTGYVLWDAASLEEATRLAEADPAVRDGVMRVRVLPFNLAVGGPAVPAPDQAPSREAIAAEALKAATERDGRAVLSCRSAFALAERLGVPVSAVGAACEKDVVRIVGCQLGCFK